MRTLIAFFWISALAAFGAVNQVPPGGAGTFGSATNVPSLPFILLPGSATNNATLSKVLTAGAGITLTTNDSTNLVIEAASGVATNLSTALSNSIVFTNAMGVGKTLYVDSLHGNDTTGTRGRFDKPFRNIDWAKTNASAGDLIYVRAGSYTNNNLLKNEVNYWFDSGSVVVWTNTGTISGTLPQGAGIFDDRIPGAVTSVVAGHAVLKFHAAPTATTDYNTNLLGAIVTTNPASRISFSLDRIEAILVEQNAMAAVYIANCGRVYLKCNEILDPWPRDTLYYDNFPDQTAASTTGIYWKIGDLHTDVKRIYATGYCLYGNETSAAGAVTDWYHKGDEMDNRKGASSAAESANAVYTVGISSLWRVWCDIGQIRTDKSCWEHFGGGKIYLYGVSKLGGLIGVSVSQSGAGEIWVEAQKISATNQWITVASPWSGTNYVSVQHYEDLGGASSAYGFSLSGGVTVLQGGHAKTLDRPALLITNGTVKVEGMTIKTGGTTNNWPIFQTRDGKVILKDTVLVVPSTGTTNSVYATNAQNVKVYGSLMSNTNQNPNVTFTTGAITVDGDVE